MKVIGKKDESLGSQFSKMIGVYLLVTALILLLFMNNYNNMIFICLCISMAILVFERVFRWIGFKKLPKDLVTMHRDHFTVNNGYKPRDINYKYLREIQLNDKKGKITFIMSGNDKVEVKYCKDIGYVRKELMDYKKKYYND